MFSIFKHHFDAEAAGKTSHKDEIIMKRTSTIGLTNSVLAELSRDRKPPCLSLYQPTHRRHPENQQDPIRYRNLLKELEGTLRQKYPDADAQTLLEPFEALAHDVEFWNHTLDGLVVLGGPNFFQTLRIPQTVAALVVVGESFYTKPMRRFLQSVDRYQVLALSLNKVRLFEGNRHALDEIELVAEVAHTMSDAMGDEHVDPQTIAPYGGLDGTSNPTHHGHGHSGKAEGSDKDAIRFFRAIDRQILEHYTKPSGLPLILAALQEHHHLFHEVSQNPLLITEGIRINPDSLTHDELRTLAWQTVEPRYQERLTHLHAAFEQARSNETGSDDLGQISEAASSGRVETLLIDGSRHPEGVLDNTNRKIKLAEGSDVHFDERLDDLGELVAKKGGTVLIIPTASMPSRTGLAAIYRY
jgi:hypothetical protein